MRAKPRLPEVATADLAIACGGEEVRPGCIFVPKGTEDGDRMFQAGSDAFLSPGGTPRDAWNARRKVAEEIWGKGATVGLPFGTGYEVCPPDIS